MQKENSTTLEQMEYLEWVLFMNYFEYNMTFKKLLSMFIFIVFVNINIGRILPGEPGPDHMRPPTWH